MICSDAEVLPGPRRIPVSTSRRGVLAVVPAVVVAVVAAVVAALVALGAPLTSPAYAGGRTPGPSAATSGVVTANTCPAVDVPSSTKAAMAVFEGTIEGTPTVTGKPAGQRGATYLHTVSVQTVYQGRIRTATVQVQTDRTPKQCSLGALESGQSYMFFVQGDGNPWVAVSGAGTAKATDDLVSQVRSVLGEGRSPTPPTPVSAQFTPLHPAAPQSLTRSAAPGVALLLVGLLGLALVRSVTRRTRR